MERFDSSKGLMGLSSALVVVLGLVAAGVLSLPSEAFAAASPCDDQAMLQKRLEDFDSRWNASDAWGLTAQFAMDGSLGGAVGRQAVYRELVERLGRGQPARQTRVVRSTDVGRACLVDVQVRSGGRQEAGVFLLAHGRDDGIVAMR